jgi:predicted RNA-binding protein
MELKKLIDALNEAREQLGDDAEVVIDILDIDTDLPSGIKRIDIQENAVWIVSED